MSSTGRLTRKYGRAFTIEGTGTTIKGILDNGDAFVTFHRDAEISPADVLIDQVTGNGFVVTGIQRAADYCVANLVKFHLRCSITRSSSGTRNSSGRADSVPVTIAENIPAKFSNPGTATLPGGVDLRQGDLLNIGKINEVFLVRAIALSNEPGRIDAQVSKQNFSGAEVRRES